MNNIELKNGDVIVMTIHRDDVIAIFNKIDKSLWGTIDAFHLYAELYKNSLTCIGDTNECAVDINDIHYRLATDEEKHEIYNALGRRFTGDYDKDWYNHFTDSSYFDVQDFLFDVFGINVEYYDNDMIYPDFIDEIHNYIWDGLCNALGVPNKVERVESEPEMVNKQEFIAKACEILDAMLYMRDCGDYDCVASAYDTVEDFINRFCEAMEE